MQRRRRRRSAPRDIFGSMRPSRRVARAPPPPVPTARKKTEEKLDEEPIEAADKEPEFPTKPSIDDVVGLVREVIEETGEADYDLKRMVSKLIKPAVIEMMTEPETKGLGLLIAEMKNAAGSRNWSVPEQGLICTELDGVSLIVDVNTTVRQKILRGNPHLELYVTPHWHPGWGDDARRVCLLGRGATATDFVYATVAMRNCGSVSLYFGETDLPSTIRKVRRKKELTALLNMQRDSNERETGIRETDEEREDRELEEKRQLQLELELEAQRDYNERETGIRETGEERYDRESEERRRRIEAERLRQLRLERRRVLDLERDYNERETGIRETDEERKERETRERWERKVSGWNRTVISELEGLESRIAQSSVLSRDSELRRRVAEIRSCISDDMWWAAYSSLGLATKRISHIEEQ